MTSAWRNGWGRTVAAVALAVAAGACDKQPGGQSLAVVDGEEITQQELRAQADTVGIPPRQDVRTYGPAMLQTLIDRNLLADYARDQGLDRGPEYIARRRQLDQALLATLATRRIVGTPPQASEAEVRRYIDANPTLFAGRQRLALDQIRFATPSSPQRVQALGRLPSLDAVAQQLRADGIAFERTRPSLDTGTIEPAVARQILGTSAGELFDFSSEGMSFISTITQRTPLPTPAAGWTAVARSALQREHSERLLKQAVDKMRAAAEIRYDPAFRPEAPSPAPTAR